MPPCAGHADQSQTAYQIVVTDAVTGSTAWDSGKVPSNESTYAAYTGAPLAPAARFHWTVATWTQDCESAPSRRARTGSRSA